MRVHFSTNDLPPRDRVSFWCDCFAQHGVRDAHYDTVSAALLSTLEAALGDEFTEAVRSAWTACYQILASEMKAAAVSGAVERDSAL